MLKSCFRACGGYATACRSLSNAANVNEGGRQISPKHSAGLDSGKAGMEQTAETAAIGQEVKAPVGEGGKASARPEAWQDVVENGDLKFVWEGGPGQAGDEDIKTGVVWPKGAEVELLSGGGLEMMTWVTLPEGLNELVVEFQAEVLGLMRHGIQDGGGEGTGAGAEFHHAFCPPNLCDFNHARAQSRG